MRLVCEERLPDYPRRIPTRRGGGERIEKEGNDHKNRKSEPQRTLLIFTFLHPCMISRHLCCSPPRPLMPGGD